jgi:glycosyltransferase involved in cell wall biosynthesis
VTATRRIAVVGACPYPVAQGSQVYLTACARTYQELGHDVHLCVYGYGTGDDPPDLTIHRAPTVPFARQTKAGPSWAKPLQDLRMVGFLKRLIKTHDIEVLDAHNYEGLLVSLATGFKPIIYHAHNAMNDELPHYSGFGSIGKSLGEMLDRSLPRRASHLIAPHDRLRDYLLESRCSEDRISVIPPGIDPEPFVHEKEYSDSPAILYAGNLDAYQNPEMLAEVMERIHAERPDTPRIVATNNATELPYAEVAPIPDLDQLKQTLSRDAVFLCPRTSWSGYPIKLLNAMAAGLPIVACASSAYPVVDGETGFVVPDDDAAAMAMRCIEILDNHDLRCQMGQAAKKRSFDLYAQRDMIGEIIQQVTA